MKDQGHTNRPANVQDELDGVLSRLHAILRQSERIKNGIVGPEPEAARENEKSAHSNVRSKAREASALCDQIQGVLERVADEVVVTDRPMNKIA